MVINRELILNVSFLLQKKKNYEEAQNDCLPMMERCFISTSLF